MFTGGSPKPGKTSPSGGLARSPAVGSTSPKIQGTSGVARPLRGDMNANGSITGEVDLDELFGAPDTEDMRQGPQVTKLQRPSRSIEVEPPRPVVTPAIAGQVPEYYVKKVEEYITDHFYDIEARMRSLEQKLNDVANNASRREGQVAEVFQTVKNLIELQFNEAKKGLGRDNETKLMAQQFENLRNEVLVKQSTDISQLRVELDSFHKELQGHADSLIEEIEGKLRKRDDATYRFEADLMAIKKSFSSLRLEFQKSKKGQDFKNTSTSVFFLKAIDMKPEERKRILRTLTEQEEKCRGAVEKAEADLREHEKEVHTK